MRCAAASGAAFVGRGRRYSAAVVGRSRCPGIRVDRDERDPAPHDECSGQRSHRRGPRAPNRRKGGAAELERTCATDSPGPVEIVIPSLGETKASGLPAKEQEPVSLGVVDRGVQRAYVAIAAVITD